MKPLFVDDRKYAYLLISTLLFASLYFAASPTGMTTGAKRNLVDAAFSSENVRAFVQENDFSVITEELTPERLVAMRVDYPQLYSDAPEASTHQIIFDAGDKALIVILSNGAVFRTWEVQL